MKTYNWEGVNPDDYYPLSLHDALPICFGGANTSYPDKFALIYEALRAKGSLESSARFVCALVLAKGDRVLFETRGIVEGRIAREPQGDGGFGYDPRSEERRVGKEGASG